MNVFINAVREIFYFYHEIAIYLLFGFLVAGVLHVLFPERIVRRHLGSNSIGSVIKATLFGVPLPLCSCGVVPVAASMRKSGASKGASVSFLITTPQIGADSFMLTYSLLGWLFAVGRIVASMITALFAGLTINFLDRSEKEQDAPSEGVTENSETAWQRLKNVPAYVEYELLGSIANTLLVGIVIAGIVAALIPQDFFAQYLGGGWLSLLIMLAIGIPLYVCASASTPIAAALMMKGLAPGAALVFLLSGPATNAANISMVVKIMGKRSTAVYLASIAVVSLALGYLLNLLSASLPMVHLFAAHQHEILPFWLKWAGSVVLGLMLLWYYAYSQFGDKIKLKKGDLLVGNVNIAVKGMTCPHCAKTVENAVLSVDGASDVVVHLNEGSVEFFIEDESKVQDVREQISNAGYEV